VIDRKSLRVKFTYNLGFTPGYAKLGPDWHLWVTDADAGRVVLFSPTAPVQKHVMTVGAGAHGIAFSGDGRTTYVTNQMANTVSVIDVEDRKVKTTINVGMKPNGLVWRDDE
jgi:YVTN family beta-propeller protein